MELPIEVLSTILATAKVFPPPQGQPGAAHDDKCRAWSAKVAEQVAFDHGRAWGVKRASSGRPQCKDCIAWNGDARGLHGWDLLVGAGTGKPKLADDPAHHFIPDQVFIPVTPTDHLGGTEPEPEPEPLPTPTPPAGPTYDEGVETARLCAEKWGALHLEPKDQGRNLVDAGQMFQWCYRMFREGWTREQIVNDVK